MTADLHLHTHYSDGSWSPKDLVDKALELKFSCIAITDHDTVAGIQEAKEHARGRIRIINGIELNTLWRNPQGKLQDLHILGYFIDTQNPPLRELIKEQQNARTNHLQASLGLLKASGFALEFEDLRKHAGKGSIGRPHICMALKEAGYVQDLQKAYKMLTNHKSEFYLARESVSPQKAIKAIHEAGGIASLAHPQKDSNIQLILSELKESGLDAVEAFHRSHSNSLVRKYQSIAAKMGLLVTGGSDCHGPFGDFPGSIGSIRISQDLLQKLDRAVDSKV